jgi:hypothetical protein
VKGIQREGRRYSTPDRQHIAREAELERLAAYRRGRQSHSALPVALVRREPAHSSRSPRDEAECRRRPRSLPPAGPVCREQVPASASATTPDGFTVKFAPACQGAAASPQRQGHASEVRIYDRVDRAERQQRVRRPYAVNKRQQA